MTLCSFHGCDRVVFVKSLALCQGHYRQKWRGKPLKPLGLPAHRRGSGSDNPAWKGDDISYAAAHSRVSARYGKAYEHRCVRCGLTAAEWSYIGGCARERVHYPRPDSRGCRYSPDPERYVPMCAQCHRAPDSALRKAD